MKSIRQLILSLITSVISFAQSDTSIYFDTQPYFESDVFPGQLIAGTPSNFAKTTDLAAPFSKIAVSNGLTEFASDFIPVQAGETLYGEIWAMRESAASGAAGTLYYGVARYDKDKKPIDGNIALTYFAAGAIHVPQTGVWIKYSGTTTLPTSHTPYAGSDGGAVRYVRAYVIINYNTGSIPTYWGGVVLRPIKRLRDSGNATFEGNVGIGTNNPIHKLAVNGTVKAKEVIVETTGWSDYVLAKNYKLLPLSEVETHINANGHLPGIPSAAQVAEQGVSVGDMQARLLAKIEELTLHQIAQEKLLSAQTSELIALRSKVAVLEARK
jgi:hypothetical protein